MKGIIQRNTIFRVLICIFWLGLIFYNGTRQGEISQKSSNEVIRIVSKFVNITADSIDKPGIQFSDVNFYVRKNAHFFQYLVLSIFMCSLVRHFKLYNSTKLFLSLFILLLFPVIDEFIQKYVPGRTSNIFDVVIDFSGGVLGMLIFNIYHKVHKKQKQAFL